MISPQLAVKDVDAAVAFYTQKLGFKHDFSMAGPDGTNNFGWVSLGKGNFGLGHDPQTYDKGKGVVFVISVPDDVNLDTYYEEIQGRGVAIVEPIQDQYWGDRTFTVHDLDGYILMFAKTLQQLPLDEVQSVHEKVTQN
ncbi:MAG TPA: VOC family protein [Phototrophicaceae bacterium]|jgi:uncharacterized glyoxalase superfamily protein PhnB|nr:VOC family protein [Phototrophicaceae bacterium]